MPVLVLYAFRFRDPLTGHTRLIFGDDQGIFTGVDNGDGTFTDVLTGHNILILFPTDIPAGPTTTLYVGRVVFTRDAFFNFTLKSVSGQATDICGALE